MGTLASGGGVITWSPRSSGEVQIRLTPTTADRTIALFVAVDFVLIVGTWAFAVWEASLSPVDGSHPWTWHVFRQVTLAHENVVGTWVASGQLLIVALLAALCFARDRDGGLRGGWTWGWAAVALLFAALSLDELGSLHERVASIETADGARVGWRFLMAGGAVLATSIVAYTTFRLRHRRTLMALVVTGTVLFLSVPIQEVVEQTLWAGGTRRPALFLVLEEGAEVGGSLAYLAAFARYAAGPTIRLPLPPRAAMASALSVVVALAVGAAVIEWFLVVAPGGDSGNPRNWFASVLATAAAVVAWSLRSTGGRPYVAVAASCAVASIYVGSQAYGYLFFETYPPMVERVQAAFGILVTITLLMVGVATKRQGKTTWARVGPLVWAALLVGVVWTPDARLVAPLTFAAASAVLTALPARAI